MISAAGSLRSTNTTTTSTSFRHPNGQVALLPLVLKVVIPGDDVIWVRERFPRHLERNSMVPLVALRLRRVPCESRFHVFTIVYSPRDRSKRAAQDQAILTTERLARDTCPNPSVGWLPGLAFTLHALARDRIDPAEVFGPAAIFDLSTSARQRTGADSPPKSTITLRSQAGTMSSPDTDVMMSIRTGSMPIWKNTSGS